MNDVAVVIRHHLNFNVARLLQEFLHVDLAIAERRERFGLRDVDRADQCGITVHDAHAASAAAARRFDDDGVAELARDTEVFFRHGAERAIRYYENVLALEPGAIDAYRSLERLYRATQHWDQVVKLYERLLTDYPKYPRRDEILFSLAYNLAEARKEKESIARYQE